VVLTALTDPGPHFGRTYRPIAPRLLHPDDLAPTRSGGALRRRVRYRDVPFAVPG
jgi:hypothetical protein